MDISLFDFHLPPELIAQTPADQRDQSRLLVYHRQTKALTIGFSKILANIYLLPISW